MGQILVAAVGPTRRDVLQAAAVVVGFSMAGVPRAQAPVAAGRTLALTEVDAFLAIRTDGCCVVYSGKVDRGTGHRIAMRKIVGQALSLPVEHIDLIEGDSARTQPGPDGGRHCSDARWRGVAPGSSDRTRGPPGLGAGRMQKPAAELTLQDEDAVAADGTRIGVGALVGGSRLNLRMNRKAALKNPAQYTLVGLSLPRPDVPAKVSSTHGCVHDFVLSGMLHARVLRPPSVGARVLSVGDDLVGHLPGVRVLRRQDFLAELARDEWAALRAAHELRVHWSDNAPLVAHQGVVDRARRGPFFAHDTVVSKCDASRQAALANAVFDATGVRLRTVPFTP